MEVGYVLSIKESLLYLDGLPSVQINDLIQNEQGIKALVKALLPDSVEAWVLSEGTVFPGQMFQKTEQTLQIGVTPAVLGRAINPLGVPIDGKGPIPKTRVTTLSLDPKAPGMNQREQITDQLISGMTLVDTLIPLSKGQRQLILGDPHSGKTSFLIDLIFGQTLQGTICIYASIGKPISQLRALINILAASKAITKTVVVAASAAEAAPLIYLTPHSAFAIARFFASKGADVLVILDDMGIHAKVYRELSLLGDRPPGRESYPGDIFFEESHLLEQAGKFNLNLGGGTITALPVAEITLSDFTTFIPTNLMSMTDGHLLFKSSLRGQGQRPAIDAHLSVSRVGRQTQSRIQSLVSSKIRQILTEGLSLETVSRFAGELPLESQVTLKKKALIEEALRQESLEFLSLALQVILLGLILTPLFDNTDHYFLAKVKKPLTDAFRKDPRLKKFTEEVLSIKTLDELIKTLVALLPILEASIPILKEKL